MRKSDALLWFSTQYYASSLLRLQNIQRHSGSGFAVHLEFKIVFSGFLQLEAEDVPDVMMQLGALVRNLDGDALFHRLHHRPHVGIAKVEFKRMLALFADIKAHSRCQRAHRMLAGKSPRADGIEAAENIELAAGDSRSIAEGKDFDVHFLNITTFLRDHALFFSSEGIGGIEKHKPMKKDYPSPESSGSASPDDAVRLRAILDTAVEGIISIDEKGIIESINRAALKMFGFTLEETVGKNVRMLMPSPFRERHNEFIQNYCRTGKAKIIGIGREVLGQRKDGSVFPLELAVSEVQLEGRRLFTGLLRDISIRRRLEREMLEAIEREQRRIGNDLHDGLYQELSGIEMLVRVLQKRLASTSASDAQAASAISGYVQQAIEQVGMVARGLSPVETASDGLMRALHDLARHVSVLFKVQCEFQCDPPVLIENHDRATHVYRITQEAINNAIKHGGARSIAICLSASYNKALLTVTDDGRGFSVDSIASSGMGLQTMHYRSDMIGARLEIRHAEPMGTVVICSFPTG